MRSERRRTSPDLCGRISVQTFQRHTASNPKAPEHRNLLISALAGNLLPDIKRQIQNRAVGMDNLSMLLQRLLLNSFKIACRQGDQLSAL